MIHTEDTVGPIPLFAHVLRYLGNGSLLHSFANGLSSLGWLAVAKEE